MTERLVDLPERTVPLWAYSVGVARLLLRSTKNETFRDSSRCAVPERQGAPRIPTSLDDLVVSEPDGELAKRIEKETGILAEDSRFFAIETARGSAT